MMPNRYLWGFDSFEGLPDTADDVKQQAFTPGLFRATKTQKQIEDTLGGPERISLIKGWFSDSLTPDLHKQRKMKPAAYIDIDSDLYISSFQALDWMFSSNLVQPGTYIGYDDWWDNPCGDG